MANARKPRSSHTFLAAFLASPKLPKTRGFAGLTLCFHKNVYTLLKSLFSNNVLAMVFISEPLKSEVFALYFEVAILLRLTEHLILNTEHYLATSKYKLTLKSIVLICSRE